MRWRCATKLLGGFLPNQAVLTGGFDHFGSQGQNVAKNPKSDIVNQPFFYLYLQVRSYCDTNHQKEIHFGQYCVYTGSNIQRYSAPPKYWLKYLCEIYSDYICLRRYILKNIRKMKKWFLLYYFMLFEIPFYASKA